MSKTARIVRQELRNSFGRISYLLVAFGLPILAVLVLGVVTLIRGESSAGSDAAADEGGTALDPTIATKLMGFLVNKEPSTHNVELSEREAEVLNLTARGLTNKEIGNQLHISNRTVQGHLRKLFSTLDVNSRTEAVTKALMLGLLDLEHEK